MLHLSVAGSGADFASCECVKFICHLNAFLSSSATKCVWLSHCRLGSVSLSLCFYCLVVVLLVCVLGLARWRFITQCA